jgi:nitrite reductase/ring-hydroxylating ferredoxin subunit
MGEFVRVASVSDIPSGEMRAFEVEGTDVIVGNWEGEFYAFGYICPHADGTLLYGWMMDGIVECPFHAGQYDLKTGEPCMPPAEGMLPLYKVQIDGDDVKVSLDRVNA